MVGIGHYSEWCGLQHFQPLRTVGTFVSTRASTGVCGMHVEVGRQPQELVVPSSTLRPHQTACPGVAVPRASGETEEWAHHQCPASHVLQRFKVKSSLSQVPHPLSHPLPGISSFLRRRWSPWIGKGYPRQWPTAYENGHCPGASCPCVGTRQQWGFC